MASVIGVNRTLQNAGTKVDHGFDGKLRVKYDEYEAAALASGSDITLAGMKAGDVIYNIVVHHDALGGSSTLKVGDTNDDDRFIVATSTASAGKLELGAIGGFGYEYTAADDIVLTTGGASITGTIKVAIYYLD